MSGPLRRYAITSKSCAISQRTIAEDDPFAADRVVDAIEEAGNNLGEIATGKPGRVIGTYEKSLVRHPYIIAYELQNVSGRESVAIVRVIHPSREWPY